MDHMTAKVSCFARAYRSAGFTEYGRNPLGFLSRQTGWQTLVLMRMELKGNNDVV